jgi:hypothetical protein
MDSISVRAQPYCSELMALSSAMLFWTSVLLSAHWALHTISTAWLIALAPLVPSDNILVIKNRHDTILITLTLLLCSRTQPNSSLGRCVKSHQDDKKDYSELPFHAKVNVLYVIAWPHDRWMSSMKLSEHHNKTTFLCAINQMWFPTWANVYLHIISNVFTRLFPLKYLTTTFTNATNGMTMFAVQLHGNHCTQ